MNECVRINIYLLHEQEDVEVSLLGVTTAADVV